MKTQIFLSISLAFLLNSYIIDGFVSEKTNEEVVEYATIVYQQDMECNVEPALELEDWMTNDSLWAYKTEKAKIGDGEEVSDEKFAIEAWMTDDNLWRL